jgi:MFS superfamily sulfate permease-like transporter
MKFNHSWGRTRTDLLAGVTVAAISLPTSHGLRADRWGGPALWAVFRHRVTLVASIFGSSSHLINALHLGVRRDRLHGRGRRFWWHQPNGAI